MVPQLLLEGKSCGAFTNDDGTFELSCDTEENGPFSLKISYVGLKSMKIEVNPFSQIIINYTSKRKYTVSVVK